MTDHHVFIKARVAFPDFEMRRRFRSEPRPQPIMQSPIPVAAYSLRTIARLAAPTSLTRNLHGPHATGSRWAVSIGGQYFSPQEFSQRFRDQALNVRISTRTDCEPAHKNTRAKRPNIFRYLTFVVERTTSRGELKSSPRAMTWMGAEPAREFSRHSRELVSMVAPEEIARLGPAAVRRQRQRYSDRRTSRRRLTPPRPESTEVVKRPQLLSLPCDNFGFQAGRLDTTSSPSTAGNYRPL